MARIPREETDGLADEHIFECQVTSAAYEVDLDEAPKEHAHNGLASARQNGRVPRPLVPFLRGLCAFEDLQAGHWITLDSFDLAMRQKHGIPSAR